MAVFIFERFMLSDALFSSYMLMRVGPPRIGRRGQFAHIPIATLNTVLLVSSSIAGNLPGLRSKRGISPNPYLLGPVHPVRLHILG